MMDKELIERIKEVGKALQEDTKKNFITVDSNGAMKYGINEVKGAMYIDLKRKRQSCDTNPETTPDAVFFNGTYWIDMCGVGDFSGDLTPKFLMDDEDGYIWADISLNSCTQDRFGELVEVHQTELVNIGEAYICINLETMQYYSVVTKNWEDIEE